MATADVEYLANRWRLVSLDAAIDLELTGQYAPEGGAEDSSDPVLVESVTVGSDRPAVQWVAGGRRQVRIRSSFVSLNQADFRIVDKLAALEALTRRDPTLGRAPRVSLTWGGIEIEGFCKVRKRIAGWWPVSGWVKRVDFEITVIESLELEIASTAGAGTGETLYRTLGDGETFEAVAGQLWGDPLLGELLRRVNPSTASGEEAGDRIKVLERTHPAMTGRVAPSSPPFLSSDADAVIEDLAASRGTTTRGVSWARLPEVVAGEV